MTSNKTLEQAALQALNTLEIAEGAFAFGHIGFVKMIKSSIADLRHALENHESAYQRGYLDGMAKPCIDCADRKLQAFKQPKQEPAAWLTDRETMHFDKEDAWRDCDGFIQALYTEPSKRS